MCGIFAVVGKSLQKQDSQKLWNFSKQFLLNRGPDGSTYFDIPEGGAVAGTRLAIVEPLASQATNVLVSNDGRYYITYNGQIYNYKNLRQKINDWEFKTFSDTEVLFALLITHGVEHTLNLIEGMFAFVFVDTETNKVFVAVDETGQKPLYYRCYNDSYIFSSDIRALQNPSLPKLTLSHKRLSETLFFRFVPGCDTLFKEIKKLIPGELLEFTNTGINSHVYRSVSAKIDKAVTKEQAIDNIKKDLHESIELTLGDEKNIAIFLSGGIDSTAVAAIAKHFDRDINTFSIGFENAPGPAFSEHWYPDEFQYSRLAAKELKSQHTEYRMSVKEYFDYFVLWSEIQGDPLLVLDPIPMIKLSELVSTKFKYVLTGSGSDEIFDGYNATDQTYAEFLSATSNSLLELFENYLTLNSRCFGADIWRLFNNPATRHDSIESLENSLNYYDLSKLDFFSIAKLLMCRGRRANYEFSMLDRTGMFNSLEARSPFAQRPIAYTALKMPQSLHTLENRPKGLLREAVKGLIPEEIRLRKKAPFAMPSGLFFSNEFIELCQLIFDANSYLSTLELIDLSYLKELWNSEIPGHRAVFPRLVQIELLLKNQSNFFTVGN